jgi:hypothetical protein
VQPLVRNHYVLRRSTLQFTWWYHFDFFCLRIQKKLGGTIKWISNKLLMNLTQKNSKLHHQLKNEVDRRIRILSKCSCDQCRNSILRFPGGTLKFTWWYGSGSGFSPNVTFEDNEFKATLRQTRKLIFGMQLYFDPTRKTTLRKWKMEDDLKKYKMEDDLNFKAVLLRLFNNNNLKNKWFWHHRDWPSLYHKVCCSIYKQTTFVSG